jgi:membrane protein DedA with SNARE-associated domain
VLLIVIAISTYIFFIPEEQIALLSGYGYFGVFAVSILTNATLFIPAPGLLLVLSFGARLNPFLVGLFAGLGAALGEISSYMAGFSGQALIENRDIYERLSLWMKKNGPITVVISAFIPNPLFDLTGIIAGALKMPLTNFLIWAAVGKILKMMIIALIGAGIINIKI